MSDFEQKLQNAKKLLDMGMIDQSRFEQMKEQIIAEIGLSTGGASSDPLAGATRIGGVTPPIDPLAGATRIGGVTNEQINMDTLAGVTRIIEPNKAMPDTSMSALDIGSSIGQYKILGEIGKGGMGSVYRARHMDEEFAKHTGDVAIKVMNLGLSEDSTFRTRFMAEAGLGRSIRHSNFVAIHDVLMEQNSVALVMDLVEGTPLSKVIGKTGMHFKDALPIIEALCAALDYLHGKGIVHRDLKPDNIIITPTKKPIILDLGIAKNTNQTDSSQTSTGLAMGTPLYMAPEQLDAKNVTSAADRYALGLIVYQMLAGKLPWNENLGQGSILAKKFSADLDPLMHQPQTIQSAVMGLLRVKEEDRWNSCQKFVEQLQAKAPTPSKTQEKKADSTPSLSLSKNNTKTSQSNIQSNTAPIPEQKSGTNPILLLVIGICLLSGLFVLLQKEDPDIPNQDSSTSAPSGSNTMTVETTLVQQSKKKISDDTSIEIKQKPPSQSSKTAQTRFNPALFLASQDSDTLLVSSGRQYPPMFDLTTSYPTGYDVDLARELAKRLGKRDVQFVRSNSPREEARAQKVDFAIAAISITPERQQKHLFSEPYFTTSQVVVMRNVGQSSYGDLSTKECGYYNTMYKNILEKYHCRIHKFATLKDLLYGLRTGEIDFTMLESQSVPDEFWKSDVIEDDRYGIVFPNDAHLLKKEVDKILRDMRSSGYLNELQIKYDIE